MPWGAGHPPATTSPRGTNVMPEPIRQQSSTQTSHPALPGTPKAPPPPPQPEAVGSHPTTGTCRPWAERPRCASVSPSQQLPCAVGIVLFFRAVRCLYATWGGFGCSGTPLGCQAGLKSVPAFCWRARSAGRDEIKPERSVHRGSPRRWEQPWDALTALPAPCLGFPPRRWERGLLPSSPAPPLCSTAPTAHPGSPEPQRDAIPIPSSHPLQSRPFPPGPAHRGRAGGAGAGCSPRPAARPTASPALPPPASSSRGRRSPGPMLLWSRAPPRPAPAPARPPPQEPQGLRPMGRVRRGSPVSGPQRVIGSNPRVSPQTRGWGAGRVPQGCCSAGARCSPRAQAGHAVGGDTGSRCPHVAVAMGTKQPATRGGRCAAPPELRHRRRRCVRTPCRMQSSAGPNLHRSAPVELGQPRAQLPGGGHSVWTGCGTLGCWVQHGWWWEQGAGPSPRVPPANECGLLPGLAHRCRLWGLAEPSWEEPIGGGRGINLSACPQCRRLSGIPPGQHCAGAAPPLSPKKSARPRGRGYPRHCPRAGRQTCLLLALLTRKVY